MYLWRNLSEGQLLAVLRWLKGRKPAARPGLASGDELAAALPQIPNAPKPPSVPR